MKIGIVLGSVRDHRKGASVADWVLSVAGTRTDAEFQLIDVLDFDLPVFSDEQLPATRAKQYSDQRVQRFSDALDACAGYVFITAEYNHGIPGGFKNAIDHVGPELANKPVAFVSYGAIGGHRAVEQWRQVAANFSLFDIRNQVGLSNFTEFDGEQVTPGDRRGDELTALFDALIPLAAKLSA